MAGLARFEIRSVGDAHGALDYFNAFHDGFITRLSLVSQDRMEADGSQTCTGVFEVELDVAHYNYGGAEAPLHSPGQLVRATFRRVQDVFLDLREGFLGNTIQRISVHLARRRIGGTTSVEDCLMLSLARQFYLEDYRRFEFRESQVFTFAEATWEELPV